MCGIAGIALDESEVYRREDLHAIVGALAHRGPDGTQFLFDDPVWLGHRRLSVIDLPGGTQPMFNEDRSVAVIFNGEIYNFVELRRRLEAAGHRFATSCDTEVIPHLYEEHGAELVLHLRGMFALAIWDRKRRRLVLARDRLGIKPLYYAQTRGGLVFASEMRALLTVAALSREIDPDGLSQFLTFDATPAPRTVLKSVHKLPAGSRLVWEDGRTRIDRYWTAADLYPPVVARTEDEAGAQLYGLLQDVIRRHLVSDVPLGVFLSGGIDSSFIAAMAAGMIDEPLRTFSISFEEESFDEGPYARTVAAHLGSRHHEVRLPARAALDLLPRLPDLMDEPLADPAVVPTYLLAREARRQVVVALSGEGSDELFYGYPTYRAHRVARRLEFTPRLVGDSLRALTAKLPASDKDFAFDFIAKRFAQGVGFRLAERHARWMSSIEPGKQSWFTPAFHATLEDPTGLAPILRIVDQAPPGADPLLVASHCDLALYLEDGILMRTDKASMANGLEVRVPFLDHELVRFARALPRELKLRGGTAKYLLRKIARERLPAEIVSRRKKGFGVPVARWLRAELRELVLDTLHESRLRAQGIFRPEAVARLIAEHQAGRQNHRKALWALLAFQLWHDRFVGDGRRQAEPPLAQGASA